LNWAALTGTWKFDGSKATFLKPQDPQFPVGTALASGAFRAGTASVMVTVEDWSDAAARVIIGYNPRSNAYFSIGLGGYTRAYVFDEYKEGVGWKGFRTSGNVANLQAKIPYKLTVSLQGQSAGLIVNDILVMETNLPSPLSGGQIGLMAWGEKPVQFEDLGFTTHKPRAFVVMKFSEPYDSLYREVIRPVADQSGFQVLRADDVFKPGIILQDIVRGIIESDVIIAEITPDNGNVFYELGYAHALLKPTILLATRNTQLPFDISGYRCIFYDDTIRGKREVEIDLERHLRNILAAGSSMAPTA
jgi:hypothetical protein